MHKYELKDDVYIPHTDILEWEGDILKFIATWYRDGKDKAVSSEYYNLPYTSQFLDDRLEIEEKRVKKSTWIFRGDVEFKFNHSDLLDVLNTLNPKTKSETVYSLIKTDGMSSLTIFLFNTCTLTPSQMEELSKDEEYSVLFR